MGLDLDALRRDIAAATRLLVREHILDYAGHLSARLPDGRILIQSRGDSRAELAPEALLVVSPDGTVEAGAERPPSELAIHAAIYAARPDVGAVLHCHMDVAVNFTLMEGQQLRPMRARAARWASGIPTHPDPSHIKSAEQGQALAETLGAHHAVLMRAHGLTLVAETPRALFVDAVHFRENALAQLEILQAGQRPLPLTAAEMAQIARLETRDWHVAKLWNFFVREGLRGGWLDPGWGLGQGPSPRYDEVVRAGG